MPDKNNNTNKESFDEVAPIYSEGPAFEIAGKEYVMRRLGVGDTFKLARILSVGAVGMGKEIANIELSPEVAIGLLIAGFPYAEKQILELLSSIIGVKYEDMLDPSKFPMGSEIVIITALVGHIDVKAFFGRLAGLLKAPAVKGFLKGVSTSSKKDTDLKTKK